MALWWKIQKNKVGSRIVQKELRARRGNKKKQHAKEVQEEKGRKSVRHVRIRLTRFCRQLVDGGSRGLLYARHESGCDAYVFYALLSGTFDSAIHRIQLNSLIKL